MRIEILIDGSDTPQIFPINKPVLVLGSGETCDVIVSGHNISRRHAQIVTEGDSYFVIDLGSTNGTYINEERLVPGRRVEFTSFFPVRLGEHVLISLLSDEESLDAAGTDPGIDLNRILPPTPAPGRGHDESTRVISLADLKRAKTSDLQARRDEIRKKSAPAKAKKIPAKKSKREQENSKFKQTVILVILVVGGIAYYNIQQTKDEVPVAKMGEIVSVSETTPETAEKPVAAVDPDAARLIPEEELPVKEKFLDYLNGLKCLTDIEKYLCEVIPAAGGDKYGVLQVGANLHIMIDGDALIREARQYVVHPAPAADGSFPPEIYNPYRDTVMDVALVLFFMKGLPENLDWERLKDYRLVFGIYEVWEGKTFIQRVAAGYPDQIKRFREVATIESLKNVKEIGDIALNFTDNYYRTY